MEIKQKSTSNCRWALKSRCAFYGFIQPLALIVWTLKKEIIKVKTQKKRFSVRPLKISNYWMPKLLRNDRSFLLRPMRDLSSILILLTSNPYPDSQNCSLNVFRQWNGVNHSLFPIQLLCLSIFPDDLRMSLSLGLIDLPHFLWHFDTAFVNLHLREASILFLVTCVGHWMGLFRFHLGLVDYFKSYLLLDQKQYLAHNLSYLFFD